MNNEKLILTVLVLVKVAQYSSQHPWFWRRG